jgi:hypothetical protein
MQWRAVGASVKGTSHVKFDLPCQDYCAYQHILVGSTPALLIAIADGAGSARLSEIGARASVDHLLRTVPAELTSILQLNEEEARRWFESTRQYLGDVASEQAAELRDLACTILFAVASESASFFAQIGDGGWVVQQNGEYFAPTWPVGGEYVNETIFLTSPNWAAGMTCRMVLGGVSAIAGFTDGLQRLALQLDSKSVHVPFFDPLFAVLRAAEYETSLISPLIEFLSSERVAERTDDDKTLVLACRNELLLLADAN